MQWQVTNEHLLLLETGGIGSFSSTSSFSANLKSQKIVQTLQRFIAEGFVSLILMVLTSELFFLPAWNKPLEKHVLEHSLRSCQ